MYKFLIVIMFCLLVMSCTVKPQATGTYHGTSGSSGGDASGSLIFSHPF
jgi:hypothetical protein